MNTISMTKLSELLTDKGIKNTFEMSGGNCGTIYIGDFDSEGYAEYAVGPSNYSADEAYFGDFCWGVDGSEVANYFEGSEADFNEANLANLIFNDFQAIKENK